MNTTKMLACFSLSLIGLGTLTACQVNVNTPEDQKRASAMPGYHGKEHSKMHHARHHQHMMQKACEGKAAGSSSQIEFKDRSITGQCELVFVPKKLSKEELKQQRDAWRADGKKMTEMRTERPRQQGAVMTDAERAERVKQYEQRLIQQQAKQKAIASACQGQKAGQSISLKIGQHQYAGSCQVVFKPSLNQATTTKS